MYRRRSLDDGFDDLHLPARSANVTNRKHVPYYSLFLQPFLFAAEPEFDFGILVCLVPFRIRSKPHSITGKGRSMWQSQVRACFCDSSHLI